MAGNNLPAAFQAVGADIKSIRRSLSGGAHAVAPRLGLTGPRKVYAGDPVEFRVSAYDVFTTYRATLGDAATPLEVNQLSGGFQFTAPTTPGPLKLVVYANEVPTEFTVNILPPFNQTPRPLSPVNVTVDKTIQALKASEFVKFNDFDTHLASAWQLATDEGFADVVRSESYSLQHLTSWEVAGLQPSKTYYWRVMYFSGMKGPTEWSTPARFQTPAVFTGDPQKIGHAGERGFGVGPYPNALPAGFSELPGTRDKTSDEYGNYKYSDGSIMVFVPRFYYRFGHQDSPRYSLYKAQAIDIVGMDTFADEASASAAGYVMHRAFKDGGVAKLGFFIDKYPASVNTQGTALTSQKGLVPAVGYASTTGINSLKDLTDPALVRLGTTNRAVLACKLRGDGVFSAPSAFMYAAINLLTVAHIQSIDSKENCEWYTPGADNFPKGWHVVKGELTSSSDSGLTFQVAPSVYVSTNYGSVIRQKAGSASNPAEVTHNGQANGISELVGGLPEFTLGVTTSGASGYPPSIPRDYEGVLCVLKESVKLADLSHDHASAMCPFQVTDKLDPLYHKVTQPNYDSYSSTATPVESPVFSGDASGNNYLLTSCGIPLMGAGLKTNLYGRSTGEIYALPAGFLVYSGNSQYYTGFMDVTLRAGEDDNPDIAFFGLRCAAFGD